MSKQLLLASSSGTRFAGGGPAANISLSGGTSYSVRTNLGVGSQVLTATTSTVGNGTWTLTKLSGIAEDFLRLRTATGKTVVIETSRTFSPTEIGINGYRVSFLGDGLGEAITRDFTASITQATITLSADPSAPRIEVGAPSGTVVTVVTQTGGAGTGSWTNPPTNYGLFTVSGSGGSRNVLTSRVVASTDLGRRNSVVRYTETGFNPVELTTPVDVVEKITRNWRSGHSDNGAYSGDVSTLEIYKNAHGQQPGSMTLFQAYPSTSTWDQIAGYMGNVNSNLYKALQWCYDNSVLPVVTLPVCQGSDYNGTTNIPNFGRVTSGTYDTAITTFASRVKSLFGSREIVFRIGHEATHFQWRISKDLFDQPGGPAAAKAAWQRVIDKLRTGMGINSNPLIGYCSTNGWTGNPDGVSKAKGLGFLLRAPYNLSYEQAFDVFYPGNDFVDIITFDFYDGGAIATPTNASTWIPQSNRANHYNLAVSKNKKFAIDEWGIGRSYAAINNQSSSSFAAYGYFPSHTEPLKSNFHYYGDNPDFVSHVFSWYASLSPSRFLYENYFRMFEAAGGGLSSANIPSGQSNTEPAIHAIYGRNGATPVYSTPFAGKGSKATSIDSQGRRVAALEGRLVGFGHSQATQESTKKYRFLWFGLTTPPL